MALIAVIGDCTTTTALAMASAWPLDREVVILEADRRGGSLTSWLDTPATPSLTTIVAARGSRSTVGQPNGHGGPVRDEGAGNHGWAGLVNAVHSSTSGVRFIAAPSRAREASLAIAEAERSLMPMLSSLDSPTIIADVGRHDGCDPLPAAVRFASTVLVVHRQDPASPGAAAVRLERLVEVVDQLVGVAGSVVLGIVGDRPFDLAEIDELVASNTSTRVAFTHPIALDPLSALVLAGRRGVSRKRLARLPLARSITHLVDGLTPTGPLAAASSETVDASIVPDLGDALVSERRR